MIALRDMARAVAALCLVLLLGCAGGAELEGRYEAQEDADVVLELHEGGKGTWATADDEVAFTWDERRGEVWLHTKSGGLIAAVVDPQGRILMDVPGVGRLTFERTGP